MSIFLLWHTCLMFWSRIYIYFQGDPGIPGRPGPPGPQGPEGRRVRALDFETNFMWDLSSDRCTVTDIDAQYLKHLDDFSLDWTTLWFCWSLTYCIKCNWWNCNCMIFKCIFSGTTWNSWSQRPERSNGRPSPKPSQRSKGQFKFHECFRCPRNWAAKFHYFLQIIKMIFLSPIQNWHNIMITSYHTSILFSHVTKFKKQEKMCTIFYLCQLYFAI